VDKLGYTEDVTNIEIANALKKNREAQEKKELGAIEKSYMPPKSPSPSPVKTSSVEKRSQPQQSRWAKFSSGTKSAFSILKTDAKQSRKSKALDKLAMVQPELAPVAMAYKKLEKYDPSKKAAAVLKAARGAMVQKYGIAAITKPRYWLLLISQVTVKHPFILFITAVIAGFILLAYTFGNVSILYELYFIKNVLVLIPNTFLSIANSIWFAVHGIYYLIITGVLDIINGIFFYFLSPVYSFLHLVFGWAGFPAWAPIGGGMPLALTPHDAFAYIAPTPIKIATLPNGQIDTWATFLGMWGGFAFMKPGSPFYATDANGTIQKEFFYSENGAKLYFPRLNPDGLSSGWWAKVEGKPPPGHSSNTIPYIFDTTSITNWWDSLSSGIIGALKEATSGDLWQQIIDYFTHFTFTGG
jgi:hypothetical protein